MAKNTIESFYKQEGDHLIMSLQDYPSFGLEYCLVVSLAFIPLTNRTLAHGHFHFLRGMAVALGRLGAFQSRRRHSTPSINTRSYRFRKAVILLLIQSVMRTTLLTLVLQSDFITVGEELLRQQFSTSHLPI